MMKTRMFFLGLIFGTILTKSEVISWYRIQEMFHFQSFYMYGVFATAIPVGIITTQLMKKFGTKTLNGDPIRWPEYHFTKGHVIGGFLFGLGWSMTGACPGPLFALAGGGYTVIIVALVSAILGTYVYGWLSDKLPQ
ncbi:MAG: YeeE/YedE family protein [Flavobacteriales bacterium]|nr:YeeE/YedE family protein [Flavobacteriales bacterium]